MSEEKELLIEFQSDDTMTGSLSVWRWRDGGILIDIDHWRYAGDRTLKADEAKQLALAILGNEIEAYAAAKVQALVDEVLEETFVVRSRFQKSLENWAMVDELRAATKQIAAKHGVTDIR